jgi:hypothetical protein
MDCDEVSYDLGRDHFVKVENELQKSAQANCNEVPHNPGQQHFIEVYYYASSKPKCAMH